jgi:hypothetical protein
MGWHQCDDRAERHSACAPQACAPLVPAAPYSSRQPHAPPSFCAPRIAHNQPGTNRPQLSVPYVSIQMVRQPTARICQAGRQRARVWPRHCRRDSGPASCGGQRQDNRSRWTYSPGGTRQRRVSDKDRPSPVRSWPTRTQIIAWSFRRLWRRDWPGRNRGAWVATNGDLHQRQRRDIPQTRSRGHQCTQGAQIAPHRYPAAGRTGAVWGRWPA